MSQPVPNPRLRLELVHEDERLVVANKAPEVRERLRAWRNARRDEVLAHREV